jgi:hypothetical protein
MFVNDNPLNPIIIGFRNVGVSAGTISAPTDYQVGQAAAQSDPTEFGKSLQRIQHIDERGNLIELSEVGGEARVRMMSGGAEVFVSMEGDKAVVTATGTVVINSSGKVDIKAGVASVDAATVNIESHDRDFLGQDAGKTRVTGSKRVIIGAFNDLTIPPVDPTGLAESSRMDIGSEIQQVAGVAVPPAPGFGLPASGTGLPHQTGEVSVMSREVNVGTSPMMHLAGPNSANILADMVFYGVTPPLLPWSVMPTVSPPAYVIPGTPFGCDLRTGDSSILPIVYPRPTMNINIRCAAKLNIEGGDINLTAHSLKADITGPNVTVTGTVAATVRSPIVTIAGEASTTLKCTGKLDINSTGPLTIESYLSPIAIKGMTKIDITAPIINLGVA